MICHPAQPGCGQDKGQKRHARHQRKQQHECRYRSQGRRIIAQLRKERHVRRALLAALGQKKRSRDRDDYSWNLADQPVTHRQDGIGPKRGFGVQIMHDETHNQPDDDVEAGNQKPRDRIALDEFRRPVQRAEKICLGQLLFTAALGFGMVDCPRRQIRINRKLAAGHPVKRKTRTNLCHPASTFGDHHEVDDQKDDEDHDPQNQVAAHDEFGKALDHMPGGIGAGMALRNDQLGRRDIQRQTQQQ